MRWWPWSKREPDPEVDTYEKRAKEIIDQRAAQITNLTAEIERAVNERRQRRRESGEAQQA